MKRYQKLMTILIAFGLHSNCAIAQFAGGFFNQKGTQRKYMAEQVVLYATYLGYLKKGYTITRDGLNTIGNIRRGELKLHTDYHRSLATVAPAIRNQKEVKDALKYQDDIREVMSAACRTVSSSNWLQAHEQRYLASVCSKLDRELRRLSDELQNVIAPGQYKMTDDERLSRINGCLKETKTLYGYVTTYASDIRSVIADRVDQSNEVDRSKVLFDLQ